MSAFDYKDIYVKEGKRILEVNLLPENIVTLIVSSAPLDALRIR